MGHVVRARRVSQRCGGHLDVDEELLPQLFLGRKDPVVGVELKVVEEDLIAALVDGAAREIGTNVLTPVEQRRRRRRRRRMMMNDTRLRSREGQRGLEGPPTLRCPRGPERDRERSRERSERHSFYEDKRTNVF